MALLKFKRSAVPGKVPTLADLSLGELAINTFDGKVYIRKDSGTASIVEVGGGSGVLSFNSRTGAVTLTSGDVTGALGYTPANRAGDTFSGAVTFSGGINPNAVFKAEGGAEGGQFLLEKGSTGTTLSGNLVVDLVGDVIRFFDGGGTNRGAFLNIMSQGTGAGSRILTDTTLTSGNVTTALGYTPANRAGDTFTGNISISGSIPSITLSSTTSGRSATFGMTDAFNFRLTAPNGGVLFLDAFRAPLFSDTDNTAYFLDPANAGTSLLTAGGVQFYPQDGFRFTSASAISAMRFGSSFTGESTAEWAYNRATAVTTLSVGNTGSALNTRLSIGSGGSVTASVDFRAPIFLDSDNTAFFVDPAGNSILSTLRASNIQFPSGTVAINLDNTSYQILRDPTGNIALYLGGADPANYYDNSAHRFRGRGGAQYAEINANGAYFPIYYDNNNTSFLADPSDVSRLSAIYARGQVRATGWWGEYSGSPTGLGVEIGQSGGRSFVLSYNRDVANYGPMSFEATDYFFASIPGSFVRTDTSFRAPIFFDSNNTAFFVDPNGTSNLSGLTVNGGAVYRSDWTTRFQSSSDFVSGTLVSTDIPATGWAGDSFIIEITGKSYDGSNPPFKAVAQGYLYNDTIINFSGINYGGSFSSFIRVFQDGGVLKFWWPRISYWNSFNVNVMSMDGPTNGGITRNRVTSITDSAEPTGTKKQTITLNQALRENTWIGNKYFGSDGAVYGTIFYDSNNSGFYADPHNISRLNDVDANQVYSYGWLRNHNSGLGVYNQATGQHFYSDSGNGWNIASGAGSQWLRFRTGGYGGTINGYVYAESNNNFGLLNHQGNWCLQVVGGDWVLVPGSSVRAPIFYDSNNTGFYTDPASTSVLNTVNLSRINMANSNSVYADGDANAGWRFGGTGYVYFNQASPSYFQTRVIARDGISQDSAALLILHGGTSAGTQINTDTRSPIYYDLNNTGFYLDPNGNSVLANVSLGGQTWRNDITWNNGVNIFANGENSFDVASGATWGVWDTPTGNYMISAAANNQVQIGAAGSRGLYVWGAITATGNVTAFSDIRVKDNVEQIGGALDRLQAIRGVIYTRNDLEDKERRYAGVIAQEIEAVLPEAVFDSDGKKSVDYNATIGLLIEAIKELRAEVAELKGK